MNRRNFLQLSVMLFGVNLSIATSPALAQQDVVGPVVGAVEPTAVRILYRPAAEETKLQLQVFRDGQVAQRVAAEARSENDFVAKFAVTGLEPATRYTYQVKDASGRLLGAADEEHSFQTANPARENHRVSVSFVSCVDMEPSGIWEELKRLRVDMVCLMGDTPYIDSSDLNVVRTRHRNFLQMPALAALSAHTPTVGTWDDHDFGRNNGNGRNMQAGKSTTRRGFIEYRAHAQFGNGKQGVYHKVDLGMIEVFLLDPRYFSQTQPSPVDNTQPTCFGSDQWQWLLKSLRESKAPFKVLASGAIWQDKKNSETDDMFTYWYERDALLDYIKAEKISGVVLLGGDIHVARHLMHPQRVGYDLHDFIISPGHQHVITKLDVYHPSLEWSLVEGNQFLTLTADGQADEATLIAEFRQPDGKLNRKVVIPLAEMTHAAVEPESDAQLRGHWSFDSDFSNRSLLGDRIDAEPVNGAALVHDGDGSEGAARFDRSKQQYLVVPRSFLDDNSAAHTLSLWFKPTSLPEHDSDARSFLLESTAQGRPSQKGAYHLSLGLRAGANPDKVNLQLFTHTLRPADRPEAAPTPAAQGPFNTLVDRSQLLDRWNHVAVAFDSKSLTLFLNGEQVAKHVLPVQGPASEFGGLVIGGHRAGTGRNYDGLIDELTVWQGALPPPAIKSLSESRDQEPAHALSHQ
ncbi:alkaline phosphatase D family protein [Roseimaritima sediminicola]|uniref:alkaline phosphatase D family protein n=1 Tax=Roseimaritima sediminicola TaxID=2662066 RepID=UPI001298421E|nr:alkaline phosphatase D family protein [Roseimaritima sediminicola]